MRKIYKNSNEQEFYSKPKTLFYNGLNIIQPAEEILLLAGWEIIEQLEPVLEVEEIPLDKQYACLVDSLIRNRYSQADVEALIQNYIVDSEKYGTEWAALQAFRAECKALAKLLIYGEDA